MRIYTAILFAVFAHVLAAQPALTNSTTVKAVDGNSFLTFNLSTLTDFLLPGGVNELAQDAVGGIMVDGNTVNFTYSDVTPQITAEVLTQMSLTSDGSGVKLSGDLASPGNDMLYGTNASGVKGWYVQPGGGGGGGSVATDGIWDVKGDMAIGTGANTAARLPVGSAGQTLYVESPTSTGLRWGAKTITPTTITADEDNYSPPEFDIARYIRISGDNGFWAITSFAAGASGDEKVFINVGDYPVYFPGEHPDGTAANRLYLGSDYILFPKSAITFVYDATLTRWVATNNNVNARAFEGLFYRMRPSSVTLADIAEWTVLTTGTAASTTTVVGGTHPGGVAMNTGSTSTGAVNIYFAKTLISPGSFNNAHMYAVWKMSVPTLSDGTQSYTAAFTITNQPNSLALNANSSGGIRYTHSTFGGNFELFTRSAGGAETSVDSGVTVSTFTVYTLRIEVSKTNDEFRYYINDVFVGRINTNMPGSVAAGCEATVVKSAGTGTRTVNIHSGDFGIIFP